MSDVGQVDAFELRLRRAFQVSLPAAPSSVLDRLEVVPVSKGEPRPRAALVLLPAAAALILLVAVITVGGGPRPTSTATPPEGLFERIPVNAFEGASIVTDVWAQGSGFVAVVWGISDGVERAELVRSEDGRTWRRVPPPREGFVVQTGVVVNGELHVLGWTGTDAAPVWWHEAIDERDNWREVGLVNGLPGSMRVLELAHGSAGWLARVGFNDQAAEAASGDSQIRFSRDGVDWIQPPVEAMVQPPNENAGEGEAPTRYTGVASNGTSLFVFRYLDTDLPTATEIVSIDGETATVNDVTSTMPGPRFMAFDGERFVGVGSAFTDDAAAGSATEPAAWTSVDGATWQQSNLERPTGQVSESLKVVTTSDAGFVAVGYTQGDVWLSPDGATWRSFAALPEGQTWTPYAVAALGNEIVIASIGADSKPAVWVRRPSDTLLP